MQFECKMCLETAITCALAIIFLIAMGENSYYVVTHYSIKWGNLYCNRLIKGSAPISNNHLSMCRTYERLEIKVLCSLNRCSVGRKKMCWLPVSVTFG